jgi:ribosomal-protein-alanine N-acetyltransferase
MTLRRASLADCQVLEFIHASCFPHEPWSAAAFAELLVSPGMFALLASVSEPDGEEDWPAGFILARAIAGEAEIVTIAVNPTHQRAGLGAALLAGALEAARAAGAEAAFLEVAENNNPAYQLYTRHGFIKIGRRPNYYSQKDAAVAALVMRLKLLRSSVDHS